MKQLTVRQVRGMKDLTQDVLDATVVAVEEIHRDIARKPYAILAQVSIIAAPVRAIEQVQQAITDVAYHSIRAVNRLAGTCATKAFDQLEALEEQGILSRHHD